MKPLFAILPLLLATACSERSRPAADNDSAPTPPAASPAPAPATASAPAPEAGPNAAEKTPAGAVAVLQAYCDAIARKDFAAAYRAWGDGGRASGMSEASFAASMAKYDAYDCSFSPPLDEQGAAGSLYLTVPAVITGTLSRGGGFTLRGPFTMRRVNDVDGSTADQRRWHIDRAELKPGP